MSCSQVTLQPFESSTQLIWLKRDGRSGDCGGGSGEALRAFDENAGAGATAGTGADAVGDAAVARIRGAAAARPTRVDAVAAVKVERASLDRIF